MSYHGYLPLLKQQLHQLPHPPAMLEVGVDRGVSFLTLVTFLARTKPGFLAIGVDVKVQEQVQIMLSNLDLQPQQSAYLLQRNSLDVLPEMVEQGMKFDLVLLDGDHNYHTVRRELDSLIRLVKPHGVILCDDYDGKWSERDLWYAERAGYETVAATTSPVDTDKHGVKPAIDDWIAANPTWHKLKLMPGEPILLTQNPPEKT